MVPEFWFLYTATVFLASIIPGPSMLLALSHGMKYGTGKTVVSALGNVTASLIQAMISIAGLGVVLMASETVFHVIRWAGAVYLVGIGVSLLMSANRTDNANPERSSSEPVSLVRMFSQAFFVASGNPKAIVFFSALFPQFINPQSSNGIQFVLLMLTLAVTAFFCFMLYAVCGETLMGLFSGRRVGSTVRRVTGCAFIGSGVGIAINR